MAEIRVIGRMDDKNRRVVDICYEVIVCLLGGDVGY